MKKVFISIMVALLGAFAIYQTGVSVDLTNIKYTVNIVAGGKTMKYTIYQKGDKYKFLNEMMTVYTNKATNESIIYMPQQKMAFKQKSAKTDDIIVDNETVKKYQQTFVKAGTKTINGYTCTVYTNNKNIEACISETLGLAIQVKTPDSILTTSNISQGTISDSEFVLPAGIPVQDMSALITPYANNNRPNTVTPSSTNYYKRPANTTHNTNTFSDFTKNLPF